MPRHVACDLFTITWLEKNELGTMTGCLSGFSIDVDVNPISTTFPSIKPTLIVSPIEKG
jgi:hypothetical protein